MAVFGTDPNVWQRLDLRLLQNGPIALYWRRDILDEDIAWLREARYDIDTIDCGGWRSEDVVHSDLAEQLFKRAITHLELPPVGALGVGFNPREWLASARGN